MQVLHTFGKQVCTQSIIALVIKDSLLDRGTSIGASAIQDLPESQENLPGSFRRRAKTFLSRMKPPSQTSKWLAIHFHSAVSAKPEAIETIARVCSDQQIIPKAFRLKDFFAPNTLDL